MKKFLVKYLSILFIINLGCIGKKTSYKFSKQPLICSQLINRKSKRNIATSMYVTEEAKTNSEKRAYVYSDQVYVFKSKPMDIL